MIGGTLSKPVAMVTGMLLSSGKLQLVVLFTFIALVELLLSVSVFVCPCDTDLKMLYGLSFLIVPAVILFIADFPWKLALPRPPARILLYMARRPMGMGLTWFIVGLIERKFVSCMVNDFKENCDRDSRVTWLQLVGLYLWLAVVVTVIVLLLCRRRSGNYGDRGSMAELITKFEINESMEKEAMQKRIRYGSTRVLCEDDVSLAVLQVVQPGISSRTYEALAREQLLRWSIMTQLRDDDLLALDVSLAQRCLLRGLLTQLRRNPDLAQCMRQNKSQTPAGLDPTNMV